MTELQDLPNQEALLANTGYGDSDQRRHLHTIIRLVRDETNRPGCFGDDDCSTITLSQCPWRMDCGAEPYYNWGG